MRDTLTLGRNDLLRAGALGRLTLGIGGLFTALAQAGQERRTIMRRALAFALAMVAGPAMAASTIDMHRDPGCSCCAKWAAQVQRDLGRKVRTIDDAGRAALMRRLGVPRALAGCHTAIIDGLVVEGHVPVVDIRRALADRRHGTVGLAVPGMPAGSPGMEAPGRAERYVVYSFGAGKPQVFARH